MRKIAAVYDRAANSEFVDETVTYEGTLAAALNGTATERLRFSRTLDGMGRLGSANTTRPATGVVEGRQFGYGSNDTRTTDTRHDGMKWEYGNNGFIPAQDGAFTYDDDGNMTGDSLWTYVWDGENRVHPGSDGVLCGG